MRWQTSCKERRIDFLHLRASATKESPICELSALSNCNASTSCVPSAAHTLPTTPDNVCAIVKMSAFIAELLLISTKSRRTSHERYAALVNITDVLNPDLILVTLKRLVVRKPFHLYQKILMLEERLREHIIGDRGMIYFAFLQRSKNLTCYLMNWYTLKAISMIGSK